MSANSVKKKNSSDYGSINSRALQMIRDQSARERQQVVEPLTQKKNAALDAYLNRGDFQYDLNADALYHHYKDQYTQKGKAAMQDTMGQAAALTGGYGSSYAQKAGQQAYDAQLQGLNNVIPELYQMAYNRYRDKGSDLLGNYSRLAAEEADAYDRQYRKEQDAISDYQWQQQYDYRKEQDAVSDYQWQQQYDYRKEQDAVSNYQWQQQFDYRKEQDRLDYALAMEKLALQNQSKTGTISYDNGSVSKGNVVTMQRILGLPATGYWGIAAYEAAGNKTAEEAWADYQRGALQFRYSPAPDPLEATKKEWTSVLPHTDATRAFISAMPREGDFGDQTAYRNYIIHELDEAKDLSNEEKLTLAVYYGVREAFDPKAGH